MTDYCQITANCTFPPHDPSEHPCGTPHVPGSPCRYCDKPTPQNGDPCPECWTPINLATFKGWAAAQGLDTTFSTDRSAHE